MRIVYVGDHLDVAVPELGFVVRRNVAFDVPDSKAAVAARLLEQTDAWREDRPATPADKTAKEGK